jgi:hypothetical protein
MANGWYQLSLRKSFDQKNGQTRVTEVWHKKTTSFLNIDASNANAFDRSSSYEKGYHTYTESYYVDIPASGQVSIRAGVAEEPIETHPMFHKGPFIIANDEWVKYRNWLNDASSWSPTQGTTNFQKLWELKKKGIDSYLAATCEASITKFEASPADSTDVGTIQAESELPNLSDDKDWILFSVNGTKDGAKNKWLNTYTYKASGKGGWEPKLYS